MHKIRTSFSDVVKLAGHAVSNKQEEQDRDPGSRVILQSTKMRLYQFSSRVHNIKTSNYHSFIFSSCLILLVRTSGTLCYQPILFRHPSCFSSQYHVRLLHVADRFHTASHLGQFKFALAVVFVHCISLALAPAPVMLPHFHLEPPFGAT